MKKLKTFSKKTILKHLKYHPLQETVVDLIIGKTKNSDRAFNRLLVMYYFSQMATTMRTTVSLLDRGSNIPVNIYALNLAKSGHGKGHAKYIIANELLRSFYSQYKNLTKNSIISKTIREYAKKLAVKNDTTEDEEIDNLVSQYNSAGPALTSFDAATTPALKQYRNKLILGGTGALSLIVDEIGSNLQEQNDILTTFLELYDMGLTGTKLIKHTKEQARTTEFTGATPTTMLLFGTPDELFDGGKTEALLNLLIKIGLSRRTFFGYNDLDKEVALGDPKEIYKNAILASNPTKAKKLRVYFGKLANKKYHNINYVASPKVSILLISYEQYCVQRALQTVDNNLKAHLIHAHFRVVKLAAVYAFIDKEPLQEKHVYYAIRQAEDSITVLDEKILNREKPYIKLAKYLAKLNQKVTHSDLHDSLNYYPKATAARSEILSLARSWGYRNNITIESTYESSVELLYGYSLKKTKLDSLIISHSKDISTNYQNEIYSIDTLKKMFNVQGINWINHHTKKGIRRKNTMKKGFNLIVLDIDKKVSINTVKILLHDYHYLLYTTKRHTKKKPRFRVVMPMSHILELNEKKYAKFMRNFFNWLPFDVDLATNQRNRKWLTEKSTVYENTGALIDIRQHIPNAPSQTIGDVDSTAKIGNMNNIEKWFFNEYKDGTRSNVLIRYAFVLIDQGLNENQVKHYIKSFNSKAGKHKLPMEEVKRTVYQTVHKKLN